MCNATPAPNLRVHHHMSVMSRPKPGYQPSLPAFLFLILALLLPLFDGESMINADSDPARHLRHGETILSQGAVIRKDAFSWTRPGEPFLGFEYGSQVLIALAHRAGGTPGMVILTSLVIAGTMAGLASWLLRRGVDPLLAVLATTSSALLTSLHWIARPHVFSWPLILVLFFWLERDRRPPLWAFALLFTVWANLHGAFIFGWVLIGMYLIGHLLEYATARDPDLRRSELAAARTLGTVAVVTVLATMINPYGWHTTWHVVEFFRIPWLKELTQEFQSPDFNTRDLKPFLAALMCMMVVLSFRPRPRWTHLVCIVGTAGMGLIAQRNITQFGLIAVPLLALLLNDPWNRHVGVTGFARRFALGATTGRNAPWMALVSALLIVFALSHGRIGNHQVLADGWSPQQYPVAAAEWGRRNEVRGRVFNEMIWGGYLVWAWPELKIFLDGGTDFFGGRIMHVHSWISTLQPGWRDSMAAFDVNLALLPPRGALAAELLRDPEWVARYCDGTAVFLSRAGAITPSDSVPRSRCVPAVRQVGGP